MKMSSDSTFAKTERGVIYTPLFSYDSMGDKMKKVFICICVLLCLSACSKKEFSGTVTAQSASPLYGWTDYLKVTYEDGEIVAAEYDAFDFEGIKKSEYGENYGMPYQPSEWQPLIAQSVVEAKTSENMMPVSGATRSSKQCKKLFAAIEQAVERGETDEVIKVEYQFE